MPNHSLKISKDPGSARRKQEEAKSLLDHLKSWMKPKYLDGKNPIGRAHTGHGFRPAKNASLNFTSLLGRPYDPQMRIRPGDPQQQLRQFSNNLGLIERIHNTYVPGRGVKLAD